ncbi:MAG: 2-oxo acid dehydrogenase subunit E2, partial [Promethearchaeota archaeon]
PRFIRRIIIRRMFSHPMMKKKLMGTVGVTSVGMGTKGSGFMIHITPHTASLGVGGIGTHVVMVDGNPVEHYFVSLTCAMNHQIVDGAPAARFMNQLRIMIEKGCLEDNVDWCLKSI